MTRFPQIPVFSWVLRYVKKGGGGYITVAVKGGALKLEVGGIYYMERLGHQLMFHTSDGVYASPATLQQMEETLADKGFIRCNKGYLVNLSYVAGYSKTEVTLTNGVRLLLSKYKYQDFVKAYLHFLKKERAYE